MLPIIHDNGTLLLPENATELSGEQLIKIAGVLHGSHTNLDASLRVLWALSNMGWWQWFRLPAEVKLKCMPYVQWVFEEWYVTKQLIPVYKKYYGPSEGLCNLTLSEFYFTEKAYSNIVENKNDAEALNELVAILYRPAKPNYDIAKNLDGDCRIAFNNNATDFYKKQISQWATDVKQAILLFYDGCRKKIADENPEIFSGTSSSDNESDGDMFGILRGLASDGKYGDFEKVEKLPLYTALYEMNFLIAENKRLETQLKKQ